MGVAIRFAFGEDGGNGVVAELVEIMQSGGDVVGVGGEVGLDRRMGDVH